MTVLIAETILHNQQATPHTDLLLYSIHHVRVVYLTCRYEMLCMQNAPLSLYIRIAYTLMFNIIPFLYLGTERYTLTQIQRRKHALLNLFRTAVPFWGQTTQIVRLRS